MKDPERAEQPVKGGGRQRQKGSSRGAGKEEGSGKDKSTKGVAKIEKGRGGTGVGVGGARILGPGRERVLQS